MFRTPSVAVLAAFLFAIGATPVAFAAPGLVAVYLIPLAFMVWVLRVRTTADAGGLVVRQVLTSRALPWTALKGLRLTKRAGVRAVLDDGAEVPLPSVRVRHLPALALVSGGRLDDPTVTRDDDQADADPARTEPAATAPTAPEQERSEPERRAE
ncbi:PH domain-containing protein [Actinokineospora iranica]|uniref:PH domain-containing protein n=1 Tax=Actinokineospora iranica TaxID=1271860 RepID=A0A1G6N4B0_9PSEU|nr:PH domain-containing protein [Actinokineospora iranica]